MNKIISRHTFFKHCVYADDLYLIAKFKDQIQLQHKFNLIAEELYTWCQTTGAKISVNKSKVLHICRKRSCSPTTLFINQLALDNVDKLKILGIIFSKNYKWSSHIAYVKKALVNRLNLIKCLTSFHSLSHPNITLEILKAIISSKIDYGLPIYGQAAKADMGTLETVYNAAARCSLGAFRSTPITNILVESGLPTINQRVNVLTAKLIHKLIMPKEQMFPRNILTRNSSKLPSAIDRIVFQARELGLAINAQPPHLSCKPAWMLENHSIIKSL